MGRFLEDFYHKLRKAVSPGDEVVEVTPTKAESKLENKIENKIENKVEKEQLETSRLQKANTPQLVEGKDFYWEGQYMVLTAKYLLNRGYCCESGCRHCPYGFNRNLRKKT